MSPHIQEALIGGLIASIPIVITQLIAIGSLKRMFREYPPHRHVGNDVLYPRGYEPGEVRKLKVNGMATE